MPSTKWTPEDLPSLSGKIAVVTGASSGIGLHTAYYLAKADAKVIMACRDLEKGEAARHFIMQWVMNGDIEVAPLDLASLSSIRAFSEAFLERRRCLDILVNNAGVMALPRRRTTADGFELQFGTNHLGHFALTGLLLPPLLRAPAARVVTVSSIAHRGGQIRFDDLNWRRGYEPWPAYRQSKLANLLFGFELERRLRRAGAAPISVVAHPGVANTNLFAAGPGQGNTWLSRIVPRLVAIVGQSEEQGALPVIYAAAAPEVRGGGFYGPKGLGQIRGRPTEVKPEPQANNTALAARLWDVSEDLTGVRYWAIERP
jgi:NAD(P)-dependent dehydrogenase (short-subunit alcohol dehydrogenase family)